MIGIPQAAAELEAPAATLEELHERLSAYIGRTVTVEDRYTKLSVKTVAKLEQASLSIDTRIRSKEPEVSLQLVLSGDASGSPRQVWLSSRLWVLTDDSWKPIHTYDPRVGREISA